MRKSFYILLSFLLAANLCIAGKSASIAKASSVPVIDGIKDAIWETTVAQEINSLTNAGTGDPTISGTWSAMWDETSLYLLVEVTDDIRLNNGAGNAVWYIHDCIEVFTDLMNTKADVAVTNSGGQYQLRFIYGLDQEPIFENPTMTGYEYVSKDNSAKDGYIMEIKFPWSHLTANTAVTIEKGLKFGLDIKMVDVDIATSGDWWPAHFEYAWNNGGEKKPINFGEVELGDIPAKSSIAYSTFTAPSIDGNIDAIWSSVTSNSISTLTNAGTGNPTVEASWKALWDNDNFYMLFDVKDDVLINNDAGNDVWYIHDCIEVFTDIEFTQKDSAVSNSNGQYQLRFIYGLDNEPIFENPTMTSYKSVSKPNSAGDGYVIEVKFPWSLLTANTRVSIADGSKFGIDFKVTDIDEATTGNWWPSHYEYVWNNAAGKQPVNFGTIQFKQAADTEKPSAPSSLAGTLTDLSVKLTWNASTDNVAVTGYNIKNVKSGSILMASVAGYVKTKTLKLEPGIEYKFVVTAIDAAGNESAQSNQVAIVTEGITPLPAGTTIAKAASSISIDGKADEASWTTASYLIARIDTWAPNYEINSESDFSANFKGLWDSNNLYFFFTVKDEAVYQGVGDIANKWVQDCIEVIIAKDASTNYKYRFVYGQDNLSVISENEEEVPAGFKNVAVKTPTGYNIEVSIPWTSIPEIQVAVDRTSTLNVSLSALDIDIDDANDYTDVSGILAWPYGNLSNVIVMGNASDVVTNETAPAAPSTLTAVAKDYKSIDLSWNASSDKDVLLYTVLINDDYVATTNGLTYMVAGLEAETTYSFKVLANNTQKYSTTSSAATATTKVKPIPVTRKVGIAKIDIDPSIEYEVWDTIKGASLFHPETTFDVADLSAEWKALWDENFLYFQINVHDADIYNTGSGGWENDNIELHFDMNNESDGTSCETVDATVQIDNFQYRFIAYDKVTQTGSGNAPVWTGIQVNYFDISEAGQTVGYTTEIAIPWTSLTSEKSDQITFKPQIPNEFAFEIKVTDKDPFVNDKGVTVYDNTTTNGEICWNLQDYSFSPNRNNSTYGKIYLSDHQKPFVSVNGLKDRNNTLQIYPNPASSILNIKLPSADISEILITNISGKVIAHKTIESEKESTIQMDISNCNSGIYFISGFSSNSNISFRSKFIVK